MAAYVHLQILRRFPPTIVLCVHITVQQKTLEMQRTGHKYLCMVLPKFVKVYNCIIIHNYYYYYY